MKHTDTVDTYIPFGEQWAKEMNKLPKAMLIKMLADANKLRQQKVQQEGQGEGKRIIDLLEQIDKKYDEILSSATPPPTDHAEQGERVTWHEVSKKPEKDKWVLLANEHWVGVGKFLGEFDNYDDEPEEDCARPDYSQWSDETGQYINPVPTHWAELPTNPNLLPATIKKPMPVEADKDKERNITFEEGKCLVKRPRQNYDTTLPVPEASEKGDVISEITALLLELRDHTNGNVRDRVIKIQKLIEEAQPSAQGGFTKEDLNAAFHVFYMKGFPHNEPDFETWIKSYKRSPQPSKEWVSVEETPKEDNQ